MSSFDLNHALGVPGLDRSMDEVEKTMARVLHSKNERIEQPLQRLLARRSKRLRPALVIAVANGLAAPINQDVIAGAAAVELVHLGSLIHDDIIDAAETRWNIPTINAREGNDHAIIVGDYVFAKACQLAATVSAAVAEATASTITDLCDGQSRELADDHNLDRTVESTLLSITGKTATLLASACAIGGLCAGADPKVVKALRNYGKNFGLAFQLVDDLLDFIADPKMFGKAVGNDVKEGVYSMPMVLLLQSPDGASVRKLLKQKTVDTEKLIELMFKRNIVAEIIAEAKVYNHSAAKALAVIGASPLRDLPKTYLDWALGTLVAEKYRQRIEF